MLMALQTCALLCCCDGEASSGFTYVQNHGKLKGSPVLPLVEPLKVLCRTSFRNWRGKKEAVREALKVLYSKERFC